MRFSIVLFFKVQAVSAIGRKKAKSRPGAMKHAKSVKDLSVMLPSVAENEMRSKHSIFSRTTPFPEKNPLHSSSEPRASKVVPNPYSSTELQSNPSSNRPTSEYPTSPGIIDQSFSYSYSYSYEYSMSHHTSSNPSISPNPMSSKMPSSPIGINNTPQIHPSLKPGSIASHVCVDDETYRSPINENFGCEVYCGTDCAQWDNILNITELQEIFDRCPVTCHVPCR